MTLREKIEVMEAFERGEEIECSWTNCGTKWEIVKSPSWDWTSYLYRIKPYEEPKQTVIIEKWLMQTKHENYKTHFILEASREGIELHEKGVYEAKPLKLLDTYEVTL